MVLATCSKAKQLLFFELHRAGSADDLERSRDELKGLLAELSPGFRLLVDLTSLESMDLACAGQIGELMQLVDQGGVGMVVRVIPDPKKDIGMKILRFFISETSPDCHLPEARGSSGSAFALKRCRNAIVAIAPSLPRFTTIRSTLNCAQL